MEKIRTFIAIELPARVKGELSSTQMRLREATSCPARWVSAEGMHLTLCFLGEVSQAQIDTVKGVMTESAAHFPAFSLSLGNPGVFPSLRQPQIVWVGIQGSQAVLDGLHKSLEGSLRVIGYKPEGRSFSPHLTLARVRPEADITACANLATALGILQGCASVTWQVTEISLMKSQLGHGGAVYTHLYSSRLGPAS